MSENKAVGWRINKNVEPEAVEGKKWQWNENIGWKAVKVQDPTVKPENIEGFDWKFANGKWNKCKAVDWKTNKNIQPDSKRIDKQYQWNEKKGIWQLKNIQVTSPKETVPSQQPTQEQLLQTIRDEMQKMLEQKDKPTKPSHKREVSESSEEPIEEPPKAEIPKTMEEVYDNPIFKTKKSIGMIVRK
ncbi:Hypothetical_protein [Hexamita inflata]|uniref:Hypothetical_protein n=1 Tax=Hexamita inflata TaxID=28002 RepID=A0AA86P599_9EUKA|nr:Hypothetical protein HINF_LOCUS18581 [Hexamita inflata]